MISPRAWLTWSAPLARSTDALIEPTVLVAPRAPGKTSHWCLALTAAACLHFFALSFAAALDICLLEEPVVDLINEEIISIDPDLPTNYNIDRLEEVTVPGPSGTWQEAGGNDTTMRAPQAATETSARTALQCR